MTRWQLKLALIIPPAALILGCTTFQPTTLEQVRTARKPPSALRVTTATGQRLRIREPALTADSIFGMTQDRRAFVKFHTDEIRKLEAGKFDVDRTGMALILGGLIVTPIVSLFLFGISGG